MTSPPSNPMVAPSCPGTESAPASAVTVAICTFNRCDSLAGTLAAVLTHGAPGIDFDVLVVDNASTDATREVVRRFEGGPVALQYVYEAKPGVSHARNRALNEVSAPYIVFLDDDILPESGWLRAILTTFDDFKPRPAAVGGAVHLQWTNGQPHWLPDELRGVYSYIDAGPHAQRVWKLHGCNLAFPTALARRYGFDPCLGVRGGAQIPGEDIDIIVRMGRDGLPVVFQPDALVRHVVGAYRENREYVMRRSRGVGRQQALLAVKYDWPGRRGVLALMARDVWNRRDWWIRIAWSVLSGKLMRNSQERTWTRHVACRFVTFQRAMLRFAMKGESALRDGGAGSQRWF